MKRLDWIGHTSLSFSDSSPRIWSSSKNLPWNRCSKYSVILDRISLGNLRYAIYSSTCFTCREIVENRGFQSQTNTVIFIHSLFSLKLRPSKNIPPQKNKKIIIRIFIGFFSRFFSGFFLNIFVQNYKSGFFYLYSKTGKNLQKVIQKIF